MKLTAPQLVLGALLLFGAGVAFGGAGTVHFEGFGVKLKIDDARQAGVQEGRGIQYQMGRGR